jgi:hypothetical protein
METIRHHDRSRPGPERLTEQAHSVIRAHEQVNRLHATSSQAHKHKEPHRRGSLEKQKPRQARLEDIRQSVLSSNEGRSES